MTESVGCGLLLHKQLLQFPADYRWTDAGIVRIGATKMICLEIEHACPLVGHFLV